MAPHQVGLHFLHSLSQKCAPLMLGKVAQIATGHLAISKLAWPPDEIEVKPRPIVNIGQQPLPTIEDPIQLLRCSSVDHRRFQSSNRQQLTGSGETGSLIGQPPPIRELFGEGP